MNTKFFTRLVTTLTSLAMALGGLVPAALAGPGLTPATSNTGAAVLAPTYYASSPAGLRPDLVNPNGPGINTGTALRKFVDILPAVPALAPSTNVGQASMALTGAKYIPLAIPRVWPGDGADYIHLAIVEYQEQLHSDLPKATTLRGYVQIEEPSATCSEAGSLHVPLTYPNGNPIMLPDQNGVWQQVCGYDKPHYLGPMIVATKNKATRIKWSNLLPPGAATTDAFGNVTRNGDLGIPVDATLAGGALQQNRATIHMHGGLNPWISDGTPHQWTIPVGDMRFGYLNDIAVTATGSGYTSAPTVTIAAPDSLATGTASIAANAVTGIAVGSPGAFYSKANPPAVTISAPVPAAGSLATGSATVSAFRVASVAGSAPGVGYLSAPAVTVSAPPSSVTATATAALATTGTAQQKTGVGTLSIGTGGGVYLTAPTVTIAAPPSAVAATGTATVNSAGGVSGISANVGNYGYYASPTVTVAAPPAAVAATATPTLSGTSLGSVAVNATNYGYWTLPTVTVSAPTLGVQATATATLTTHSVSSVAVNANNNGYTTAPTVTVAAPPAAVQATASSTLSGTSLGGLAVATAGYGYWTAPTVTISAPTGTGAGVPATATPTISATNGSISSIAVNPGNSGYTTAPTVTIPAPPAAVNAAVTASVNATTFGVSGLTANSTNFGYWTAPTVTIAAPSNVNAAATVSTAKVVTITNAGWGYLAAPTVTVVGGTRTSGTAWTATATIANRVVTGITITGTGVYSVAPTLLIGAGTAVGTRATATATIANGVVTGFTITGAGSNYNPASPPAVAVSTAVAGATATATATVAGGAVTGYTVTGGRGYNPRVPPTITVSAPTGAGVAVRATATATVANGAVTGFTITNTGSGYTSAPTVTLSAPTASSTANVTATVAGGKVTGYTVTSGGANYLTAPAITVGAPSVTGVQAVVTPVIAGGQITALNVTTAGSGYAAAPTITISAPTASVTATATPIVSGGAVTGFTVTSAGANYATAPAVTVGAPTASVQATATATVNATTGAVSALTITSAGLGYPSAPTVTLGAPPAATTATVTASINATTHVVSGFTVTNGGSGYRTAPTITIAPPFTPATATATANVAADGTIGGFTITNPGAGYGTVPTVTVAPPPTYAQATATATVAGGALTGVTITNPGAGYLTVPAVTVTGGGGSGGAINALVAMPTGAAFRQVPDMVGNAVGPTGYTPPMIGEGTNYYTNQQSERLMWYHDHASGTTRLNAYFGEAAPYLILDPAVDAPLAAAGVPSEIIPIVLQDKTFVPADILLEDANWDTQHWGQYGDLWFPHVYETNQNPSFWGSASQAGRWDWGPWFAVVYPSMYALPSGKYGDVTTTPEAYEDTAVINGVAYPTLTVQPKAYRFLFLNGANDRFFNVGFYLADPLQVSADGRMNTEVNAGPNTGDQPGNYPGNVFSNTPALAGLTPWPTDGRWAPLPSEMGPSMYQIGNEGGLLPHWVEQPAIPVSYDYNRRSVTVLNVSQDNDVTQACYPKCHGLYLGGAERADVIVDFSAYAGQTLILYNDAPAPNPGYDARIDYYTNNDPGNGVNYATGGAPNTQAGFGPNTRTLMQVIVQSAPIAPAFNPLSLGAGRSVGQSVGTTGPLQYAYVATQDPPIVGESAYNVVGPADTTGRFSSSYTDQYGDMFLASQNEPMFFVTNPAAKGTTLTITGIAVTGQTTATGAASGVGLGGGSSGSNPTAGSGTGYTVPPAVVISPPGCTLGTPTCVTATAIASVSGGQVVGISLTNPGAGYTEAPSVNLVAAYSLAAVGVMNGGAGYSAATPPAVTISPAAGDSGSGATAAAVVNAAGVVTGITLTNPGSGYTLQPTVTIAPPPAQAATGTAVLTSPANGTLAGVTVTSGGTYTTAPTVTFAPPPAQITATISATPFSGICCLYTIVNGGSGYLTAPTLTVVDPTGTGTGATASATIVNGSVTAVTPLTTGTLNFAKASVTATAPTGTLATAVGTAILSGSTVTGVALSNPGSGYISAPAVTFSGGVQATAQVSLSGGGTGATAAALMSNTLAFVVPAAIPNSGVPLSASAVPLALPPALANLMGCNAAQTSCPNQATAVVGRLMNPAIQELFEPFYGRMNATLGIEMPNQSLKVQTTLPLNYIDQATEQFEPNTVQMWKITHNGVDAHPVHIHLVNVQVINRVGWDGTVKPPEDNEIGWKETIKMNPLEDIMIAMRANMPQVPFGLDRSIRPQDPSQPLGVNMGFTQFYVAGLNGLPANGLPIPAGYYPAGNIAGVGDTAATPIVNSIEDYDNEYVWHCHILGHEENDFMRALVATSSPLAPAAPTGLVLTQAAAGAPVVATWVDPTPIGATLTYGNPRNELGFKLERAPTASGPWTLVAKAAANTTTASDLLLSPVASGTTVYYRVYGWNAPTVGKVIGGTNTGVGAAVTAPITLK